MAGDAYTGIRRRKQTPWTVKFGDALVSRLIAVGGIGTIAAILLVVIVLVGTALPLFRSPQIDAWHSISDTDAAEDFKPYLHIGIDDNNLMFWGMRASGEVQVRGIADGRLLKSFKLDVPQDVSITASSLSIDRRTVAVGLSDGSFQVAKIEFSSTLVSPSALPTEVNVSPESPTQSFGESVFQWFDANGVRQATVNNIEWSQPRKLGDAPVLSLDYLPSDSANLFAAKTETTALAIVGKDLVFARIETTRNRLTKKTTDSLTLSTCEMQNRTTEARPLRVVLLNGQDHAVVVWPNGTLDRYALSGEKPRLAESQTVALNCSITAASPLLARQTLLCGLDDGRLQGWMVARPTDRSSRAAGSTNETSGEQPLALNYRLTLAHEVQVGSQPITYVSSSANSHVAATCNSANELALVYVTTNTVLHQGNLPTNNEKLLQVAFGPNSHSLVAVSDKEYATAKLDLGHPEASMRGYFGKVWYEGHDFPKYIWQSSAATEQSEIKLSLMPLVFGTLKATFYAMLISVPLAILTAVYTSEFLSSSTRSRVKPVIEMMASLPSVVLGYIAALVMAPLLQEHLMAVLLALFIVPLMFVFAGTCWNLLPVDKLVRYERFRLLGLLVCLPLAVFFASSLAPICERLLFDANIIGWLGSNAGSALGGWFLLLIPMLTLVVCLLGIGPLSELQRSSAMKRSPRGFALFSLVRLCVIIGLIVTSAWGLSGLLSSCGLDLRGYLFDSYQDRNALLVGIALGFCVIPIVYTISDDALQSVPQQLRSASLGCGATPWQTTMRVVVPSAMSGLFSAIMIGLGRAVGETMVVLCAAGNTPLMEFNPFNGFKTLSAALATELPEAAKGSTHFRTLFLAAVLLFFMTLVVNTLAEFVRIRFRKRSSQL